MLDLTDWQNKKYTTRGGRPVRILCVDAIGEWPIIGTLVDFQETSLPREYPYVWDEEGKREHRYEGPNDLINAKKKREGWVNVYGKMRDNTIAFLSDAYPSEKEAGHYEMHGRIACVRIEWEE